MIWQQTTADVFLAKLTSYLFIGPFAILFHGLSGSWQETMGDIFLAGMTGQMT